MRQYVGALLVCGFLLGCGQAQFIDPKQKQQMPPPYPTAPVETPKIHQRVTEDFLWARASGELYLGFVLHLPSRHRKDVLNLLTHLIQTMEFTGSSRDGFSYLDNVHTLVRLETATGTAPGGLRWNPFLPKVEPVSQLRRSLESQLRTAEAELAFNEPFQSLPFDSLTNVVESLPVVSGPKRVGVHVIYVRDRELRYDEKSLEMGRSRFDAHLKRHAWGVTPGSFSVLSFQDKALCPTLQPDLGSMGTLLSTLVSPINGIVVDLCRLDAERGRANRFGSHPLQPVLDRILLDQHRLLLRHQAVKGSIEVRVSGRVVAPGETSYSSGEVTLSPTEQRQIAIGEPIQVSYEVAD